MDERSQPGLHDVQNVSSLSMWNLVCTGGVSVSTVKTTVTCELRMWGSVCVWGGRVHAGGEGP